MSVLDKLPGVDRLPGMERLAATLSSGAERVVDGPLRGLIDEVLRERGVPGADELAAVQARHAALGAELAAAEARLSAAEAEARSLRAEVSRLWATVDDLQHDLAESREQLVAAQAAAAAPAPAPPAEDADGHLIGDDGQATVDGQRLQVDPGLAGQRLKRARSGRWMVGGRFVRATPVQATDEPAAQPR